MQHISRQDAQLLYEQMEETLSNERLTEKERIPKYRTTLEELFRLLTQDVSTHLSGLFAKMSYVFKEYEAPRSIQNQAHELRQYANKVVHDASEEPGPTSDARCLYQLANNIAYFSKTDIPKSIQKEYEPFLDQIRQQQRRTRRPRPPKADFRAVVERVEIPENDSADNMPYILYLETEELGPVKLLIWNNKDENGFGSDLRPFARLLQPYQTIYATEIEKQRQEGEYKVSKRSLLILEPDYLLDAKELSDCKQFKGDNPLLFILNRFNKGEITDRVMVGNIVGKMLDDLATEKSFEYKKSFEHIMRTNSFGMLCMANHNGQYNNTSVMQAYQEAQKHEKTLRYALKQYPDHNFILEPTFISNKFGLQGRLDLLTERKDDPQKKDIVELKSSQRYPSLDWGMYPNHAAQTLCYDLLLSSTFPDRIGHNHILYSSAPADERPLREITGENYLEKQKLLMLRNQIVANDLRLAKGDFDPFLEILEEDIGPVPKYMDDQLVDFRETIKGLSGEPKAYFFAYLRFIFEELKVAKIGANDVTHGPDGYASLWLASKEEKVRNSDVLVYLEVGEVTDDFLITLSYKTDLFNQAPAFREGDICILYPTRDPEHLDPLRSQILKCTLISMEDGKMIVSLRNKQLHKGYFKEKKFWALERDFRESGYKKMLQALFRFLKADERTIKLLLGQVRPRFSELPDIPKGKLNPVQQAQVRRALAAQDYYLIQGPPGTGKTSNVLCEIVRHRIAEGTDVMVIAFTNRAVDEICEQLLEKEIPCIRLGHSDKPYAWHSIAREGKLGELHQKVMETRVFVATQASFTNSLDLLQFKDFDTLVVDEASQLLEPQLVGIIPYFRRFILIGDENQLPAVVVQSEESSACRDQQLQAMGLHNLRDALFSRLVRNAQQKGWEDCYGLLSIHYRMHEAVAHFPNEHFYQSKLQCGSADQSAPMPDLSVITEHHWMPLFQSSRVVFVPSSRSARSKINDEEALFTAEILQRIKRLYGDEFDPEKTVGVITPYRAQIANIKTHLPSEFQDVTIDTVERFQGSERDVIIVSFAIKSAGQLNSMQSINENGVDRKLNVALTRAKDYVILTGTEEYLRQNRVYQDLLNFIKQQNGYVLNPLKVKSVPTDLF